MQEPQSELYAAPGTALFSPLNQHPAKWAVEFGATRRGAIPARLGRPVGHYSGLRSDVHAEHRVAALGTKVRQ